MTNERFTWIIEGLARERLTDWERKFVQACEEAFEEYGNLTQRMDIKLEEVYRERGR
jgi:hypothetical protein